MSDTTADEFRRICERAREHREEFWAEVAAALTWVKPWDKVLDDTRPPFYRWFAGGMLNTCYNAVDRHVDSGRADQTALIYDSPVTGSAERITFAQLRDRTARLGGALRQLGVTRGDRSEEHTSELQSRLHLVCRLLLETKKQQQSQGQVVCYGR